MDLQTIRRIAITGVFADDVLFEKVVLKGGNALALVLGMSDRTSLDLDFSIENDFEDVADAEKRIFRALVERFASSGYVTFDLRFQQKPRSREESQNPRWGGYVVTFKLMERSKYESLGGDVDAQRRDSLVIGPNHQRVFSIDFSKHEYVHGKRPVELDDYTVYVYSPEMIAIEKLRAICQQMPDYGLRGYATPRARDFYDVHLIVSKTGMRLNTPELLALARHIFAAKEVPIKLLVKIGEYREFHRPDWDNVKASTTEQLRDFDYYFDSVLEIVASMEALWNE